MMSKKEGVEQVFDEIGELRQIRQLLSRRPTRLNDWIVPVGLAILSYFMYSLNGNFMRIEVDVKEMRSEVAHHLQNSEIHIPRATVVSRDEFVIYQSMRDKQMSDLACSLARIEDKLDKK